MPTPYDDIYDFFLAKVSDYSFVQLTEYEIRDELEKYLRSAIVKFQQSNTNLQNRDDTIKQFNATLTDFEKEILATLMVVEYLSPKIIATENMKQFLQDKEYKLYSQANHLQKMMELKKEMRLEATQLIGEYTYLDGLGGLT